MRFLIQRCYWRWKIGGRNLINVQVQMVFWNDTNADCVCDSYYMLNILPKVTVVIRKNCHYVPKENKLYLGMDNAGGHGIGNNINKYTQILEENKL